MRVAITGMGPMLPCALGAGSLAAFSLDRLEEALPGPWFDPEAMLGGRGFKYFGNATRYLLAGARQMAGGAAAEDAGLPALEGVVIGSNSCARQVQDEFDRALLKEGYLGIHPMRAPEFCPNMGAGTLSMKQKAKGFNITVMTPITAGLDAVILARKALLEGRADRAIAGAMEDDSRMTMEDGYEVRTRGGAWTLRLEARPERPGTPAGRNALADLGPSYNGFIPPATAGFYPEKVIDHLEERLEPLLAGGAEQASIAALSDPHSRELGERIVQVLERRGIRNGSIRRNRGDTAYGTLTALAQLSWMGLNAESAVCFAVSPLGHVSAIRVGNRGHMNDRTAPSAR